MSLEFLPVVFFAFLGAVVGSFSGVVAERLNTDTSFVSGRSKCNACGRTLSFADLVPILSWLLTLGRCRTCGSRVPALYLLIECALAFLFVLSYFMLSLSFELLLFLICLTLLTIIVLYDLRHTVVPTVLSLPLVLLAFFFATLVSPSEEALGTTLLTAGLIALGFWLLYALSRGRAMGLGDAPIALSLSLLVGYPLAISGLLFSFWIGALIGIIILVLRRGGPKMGIEVPFVPFLALGYLTAYFTTWTLFAFVF